ncbi:MAG: hypothetical protein HWN51_04855, partial [Desulfobacterales bacterium]|nr:hypothetical protein [Desulfobacterales bacterium]
AYARILGRVWKEEDDFKAGLLANPEETLKAEGLDPQDAKVSIITEIKEQGTLDDQIRLWEEGLSSGSIDLYIPPAPPKDAFEDVELTEEELELVAGGGCCTCAASCTCTPCCCCCD